MAWFREIIISSEYYKTDTVSRKGCKQIIGIFCSRKYIKNNQTKKNEVGQRERCLDKASIIWFNNPLQMLLKR